MKLCFLGLHGWGSWSDPIEQDGKFLGAYQERTCEHCKKRQRSLIQMLIPSRLSRLFR